MLRKILFLFSFIFLFPLSVNAQTVSELFHNGNDPVGGNPNGSITVVEFFDYECGHCSNMEPVMSRIINNNPSVRVVYKDYPVLGQTSLMAARAAIAAKKQGAYMAYHQALFASSDLNSGTMIRIAKNLGLNTSKFESDMNSSATTAQLRANAKLAKQLGIPGTPAFYIGRTDATSMGSVQGIIGEASQSELQRAIDSKK
jgi:protein-disulfide isomerase